MQNMIIYSNYKYKHTKVIYVIQIYGERTLALSFVNGTARRIDTALGSLY